MSTFYGWLGKQTARDDRVGDLARDAMEDTSSPKRAGIAGWRAHLRKVHACPAALETLEIAWREFRRTSAPSE